MRGFSIEKIRKIAEFIDKNAYKMGRSMAFWGAIIFLIYFIRTDSSPVLFLVFIVVCFYHTLFLCVMAVVMFFIKLLCKAILFLSHFFDEDSRSKYDSQNEYNTDWDKQFNKDYWQGNAYYHNHENRDGSYQKRCNDRCNNQNDRSNSNSRKNDLEIALAFYGLRIPYTEIELKEKRKELIKEAHPDAGGSEEEAKKINAYYDILKKYVS